MAITQSNYAKGLESVAYPSLAGHVVAKRFTFAVTTTILAALNDIIELAPIPVGTRPIDFILDADDLDSNGAPLLSLDVGVMTGVFGDTSQSRTMSNEIFAASTVGRTGTVVERASKKEAFRIAPSGVERSIGIKIAAIAATAAAGTIGLTVLFATE